MARNTIYAHLPGDQWEWIDQNFVELYAKDVVVEADVVALEKASIEQQRTAGVKVFLNGTDALVNIDGVLTQLSDNTKGYIAWKGKLHDFTGDDNIIWSFGDTDADTEIALSIPATDNKLSVQCKIAGTDQWLFETDDTFNADADIVVVLVHDETAPYLIVNGILVDIIFSDETDKTAWFADVSGLDNGRLGCNSIDSAGNANFLKCTINAFDAGNRVPTLAEFITWGNTGDWDFTYTNVSNTEHLNEPDFATHANWDVTNDFDDSGGNAAFVWSANQTSTLTQTNANMAIAITGQKNCKLTYTCAVTTAPDGDLAMTLTTGIAEEAIALAFTAGTHEYEFTSKGTPADFVISVVSGDDTEGSFTLDAISLIQEGNTVHADGGGISPLDWNMNVGNASSIASFTNGGVFNIPQNPALGHTTIVNGATYTLISTDTILHVTRTTDGACTITIPEALNVDGAKLIFKDAGYNASVNTITITAANVATKIENTTDDYTIVTDGSASSFYCDGTDWFKY